MNALLEVNDLEEFVKQFKEELKQEILSELINPTKVQYLFVCPCCHKKAVLNVEGTKLEVIIYEKEEK